MDAKLACIKCMCYRNKFPDLEGQANCETCRYLDPMLIPVIQEMKELELEKEFDEEE